MFHEHDSARQFIASLPVIQLFFRRSREDEDPLPMIKRLLVFADVRLGLSTLLG